MTRIQALVPIALCSLAVAAYALSPPAPTPAGAQAVMRAIPFTQPIVSFVGDMPPSSPGVLEANTAVEMRSPRQDTPGNTMQVQESSAHGATQTTEEWLTK
jgi:hypothetical protein